MTMDIETHKKIVKTDIVRFTDKRFLKTFYTFGKNYFK
jgi:hypothetical protein